MRLISSIDALEKRHRVVDENVDFPALREDVRSEPLERRLVREVADEPRTRLRVDHVNRRSFAREAFGDALADALRPSGKEKSMTSYKLVMPGDLNHYGFLFGGKMLMWVDEIAWMAVSGDYPGCHFVTVGMSEVTFHKSVHPQSVLRFETTKARVGRTSVTYHVEVFRRHIESSEETGVFTTDITFVRVGADGAKMPIGEGR